MWLLSAEVKKALESARKAGFIPSVEQQTQYEARFIGAESDSSGDRILTIAGDIAEIEIKGVITNAPDFMAMLFGGGNTVYSDIISALAIADQDESIKKAILRVESPGGTIDGLFDTIAAIQGFSKPLESIISNVGASAAFALAAQADKVTASNIATRIGSVGVRGDFEVDENTVIITSSKAPNKAPDVTTEEGIAIAREELNAIHDIFVDAIAEGRGITTEDVNANFGRGGILLANEALKRGMIDAIAAPSLKVVKNTKTTAQSGNNIEANKMDLKQLKAEHPETYAAAVQHGENTERDRVLAHMTMAEASGDMKTASAAIKDGTGLTASIQATYMAAGMNRKNITDRGDDDIDANAGDSSGNAGDEDVASDVVVLVETKLGIEGDANHV